jgi:hypothetical protein
MKPIMTPENIEVVLRIAKEGGTRNDVQEALGLSKGMARVLVERCVRDNLIGQMAAGCHQPYRLTPRWSDSQEKDWWDTEPTEEQKKTSWKELVRGVGRRSVFRTLERIDHVLCERTRRKDDASHHHHHFPRSVQMVRCC